MAAVTRRLWAAWRHVAAPAITGAVLALPLLGAPAPGRAQEQIEQQEPTPSAVEQVATPIELKDAPAFFRDRKLDDTHLEALAMGGALSLPVRLAARHALDQRRPVHVAAAPRPRRSRRHRPAGDGTEGVHRELRLLGAVSRP